MSPGSDRSFKLVRDPWIPVFDSDGRTRIVSLREAFARAGEIRDFACGPAERISLLRLLICVAQAAQETPQRDDSPEWGSFADNLIPAALAYLDRAEIVPCFELFGEGQRFLQLPTAKSETMATSKLFLHLASGGNPTHNDHEGGESRELSPSGLALALLTFQNFSPLLGRGFLGRGICVEGNAVHAFQSRPTLAATIAANCLSMDAVASLCPDEGMGRPVWEVPPGPPFPAKAPASRNATRTYLGRLVPMSRWVWLVDCARVVIGNGPEFPETPQGREPSTCIVRNEKKDIPVLLPLRLGRGVWRDLPAFTVARHGEGCPILRRGADVDRELFVGGLITDFKAKIEDAQASVFAGRIAVPARMFGDESAAEDARLDYRAGVAAAEAWEKSLWLALGTYFTSLKVEPKQSQDIRVLAQSDYWSFVEQSLPALFRILRSGDYPDEPLNHPYAKTAWHAALRDAATRAYRLHAPRGNARQLEAFTLGLRGLWPKNPSKAKVA